MLSKVAVSQFRASIGDLASGENAKQKAQAMLEWGSEGSGAVKDVAGLIHLLTKPGEYIHFDVGRNGTTVLLTLRRKPKALDFAARVAFVTRESILKKVLPNTLLNVVLLWPKHVVSGGKSFTMVKELVKLDLRDMLLVLHDPDDPKYTFSFDRLEEDDLYFGDIGETPRKEKTS